MDSSTSFDGPEFDFLSYLDTSKFDLPIGTSPQDDHQQQQLMSGLLLGQGQGSTGKGQQPSLNGTHSALDPAAAAVLAALSPTSSSASASSASGGSPLFGNLSYSSNSNANGSSSSGSAPAFMGRFAGFNGSGFGGNAYQSSLAGSTSGNSSHNDAGSSSGGSPPFDASMYGQQQRQPAQTVPDQKLFGDFSFGNHLSPQSEHWQQAYMQQALAALSAQNSNGISDAAIQQFLHSSQPNGQMPQSAGQQQGQSYHAQTNLAAGRGMFVSPTSAPEQTPSLSSNSNIGSPLSDSSFSNTNYPSAGNDLHSSMFNQQLESIDERRMSIATHGSSYGSPQIAQSQQFMGGDPSQSIGSAPASVLAPMHSLQPHSAPAHGYSQRDQQFLHMQLPQQQQQQQQQRPVARLPSGGAAVSAQQPNVGLVPASVAHHMPSVTKRDSVHHGKDASVVPVTANVQQMPRPAGAGSEVIPKTSLKRSYQQAIKQEDLMDGQGFIDMQAAIMKKSESSGTDEGDKENSAEGSGSKRTTGGHNAVEQKYRRGINDSLIMLREIVPALGHLRAVPGSAPSKRKMSQFSLAAAATPAAPEGFVDGVMAPKKLSKQLILVTATDYIRYLKSKRDELEGELENLKVTLEDCVDDASVVMNLHEQRWAPERARMAKEREAIHEDRISAKEESRKKAKLDKLERKKAQAAAGGGAVSGGAAANGKESDDDASEDDDEEDLDMDDDAAPTASASAVPAKGQARARGKTAKKPPAAGRNASNAAARRGSAAVVQTQGSDAPAPGPPKALMSVFAGVSFLGGAGYDMVYGATANSHAPSGTVPNTEAPRVWSHGLVKRSAVPTSAYLVSEHAANSLHPVQTFFLERPALLSGLVMLSIALITGYFFLHLLPSAARKVTGYNREGRRQRSRELLVRAAMDPSKVTQEQQRRALATLAGAPSSRSSQAVQAPALLLAMASTHAFGSRAPTSFTDKVDQAGLERAASAIRLLEADFSSAARDTREGKLAAFTSFCTLFTLTRSARWPQSKASLPLLTRAEAVLALVAPTVLPFAGQSVSKLASSLWKAAQARAKKDDDASLQTGSGNAWDSMALQLSLDDARRALASAQSSSSPRPLLLRIAEVRSAARLLSAWKALFVTVANATTSSVGSPGNSVSTTPTLASKTVFMQNSSTMQNGAAALDEVLSALPSSSPLVALAVLAKGVAALGSGDLISATRVAVAMSTSAAQQLESARAFRALIVGIAAGARSGPTSISDPSTRSATTLSSIDTLAYTTISWLAVRQASLAVQPESASASTKKNNVDEADEAELNSSLQIASVQLRKLFASPVFTTDATASSAEVPAAKADADAFLDAQERCVETLVAIGRKAAGLDGLSDSGTEQ